MTRPKYIASCSGGKDSVATLLLAAQHNEPLDEAVFSEVMFDKDTSGEVPEHRDFIYSDAGIEYIRVVHARSDHFCTYQGVRLGDSAETYTSQDAGTSISTGTPYMTYVTDDGKLADLFSSSFAEISSLKDRVADISFVKD